jgi:response regulator NasT
MDQIKPASKARILVADDDGLVLATLSAGLRELGYAVLEASSGIEAVRICAEEKPDLAILDMRMPGMSGIEAAKQIVKTSQVPFIFLSAFDDADIVEQAIAEGALGYLVKPVSAPQIAPTIEAALSRSSDMDSLKQKEENLSAALTSGREISIAIGLIMGETGLSTTEAETALRNYARSHRRKMSAVAADVVSAKQVFTTMIRDIHLMADQEKTITN